MWYDVGMSRIEGGVMTESPMDRVIREGVPEGDRALVSLATYRFLHMSSDAGRPSDAARSTVRRYQRDPEAFRLKERA